VFWFSPGVLDRYPEELTKYYKKAGAAVNPRLPADWRPEPIVCERASPGDFFVGRVERAGAYRVIAQTDGVWRVVETRELPAGEFRTTAPGAERVELLIDRRSHAPITE
jgi:hypothetical protein